MSKILAQLEAAQAAGETLKEELDVVQTLPPEPQPSTSQGEDSERKHASEYMKDLETALQQFKELSDSYDKAKQDFKEDKGDSEEENVDADGLEEEDAGSSLSSSEVEEDEEEEKDKMPVKEQVIASKKEDAGPKGLRKRVRRDL